MKFIESRFLTIEGLAFGRSVFVAKLANVVLSLAAVLLTYFVFKRIFVVRTIE